MAAISPWEQREYGKRLVAADYRFAKSMPNNPHWYTLRNTWKSKDDFDEVAYATRAYSYTELFLGSAWQMFNVNDRKYWTTGAEIGTKEHFTKLINMKPRDPEGHVYDEIAHDYDERFEDEGETFSDVMDLIGDLGGKSVLDIGCGTAAILDEKNPQEYWGIDPSGGMLRIAQQRRKPEKAMLLQCKFEEFVGPEFDVALCLFGSASFIRRDFIEEIELHLKPGGRYVVMALDEAYSPASLDYMRDPGLATTGLLDLPGETNKIGHYYVYDGRSGR